MKAPIKARGKGVWTFVVDLGYDADGKRIRRRHTFRGLQTDAEDFHARVLHQIATGAYIDSQDLKMRDYLEQWLSSCEANVAPKTLIRYQQIVRLHLAPALGNVLLRKLTSLHVQSYYAKALPRQLSDLILRTQSGGTLYIANGTVTMGSSASGVELSGTAGVTVLSVQRAGVFDATTIRSDHPNALLEWLEKNGYQTPKSAEPAIRHYLEQGWVFVASKVRCALADSKHTALHPLVFTFAARTPVYPTRLTAINNGACAIDLYVFGKQRATARHFGTVRCDCVASNSRPAPKGSRSALGIADSEVLALIGDAPERFLA